jgi:hypothetical protein
MISSPDTKISVNRFNGKIGIMDNVIYYFLNMVIVISDMLDIHRNRFFLHSLIQISL